MCPSNYNRFWDRVNFVKKIVILSYPLHSTPRLGGFPSEYRHPLWYGKTRMVSLPDGEKISKISLFVLAQLTNVTDARTPGDWRHRAVKSVLICLVISTRCWVKMSFFNKSNNAANMDMYRFNSHQFSPHKFQTAMRHTTTNERTSSFNYRVGHTSCPYMFIYLRNFSCVQYEKLFVPRDIAENCICNGTAVVSGPKFRRTADLRRLQLLIITHPTPASRHRLSRRRGYKKTGWASEQAANGPPVTRPVTRRECHLFHYDDAWG